ncbi:MAG: permease [bacterium]
MDLGPARHVIGEAFVGLALESAPALVLALVGAGLLRAFLHPATMGWLSRGGPSAQAARGMAFGLPLPVCSCGVLPLYEGLVIAGAPATAGLAFLVATPELGLDAVLISLPLLGGELTVARVAAAAVLAFVVARVLGPRLGGRFARGAAPTPMPRAPLMERLRLGFRFGAAELVDHTLPWILLGLAIAAVAGPLLADAGLARLPAGLDVPLFALLGIPLYVCASGATPLAAVLIHQGISPGAALAFLLTGPATNVTTFGVLGRLHGRGAALLFGLVTCGLAVGLGYAVNLVASPGSVPVITAPTPEEAGLLRPICLAILGALFLASLVRQGPRGVLGQITDPVHSR